VCLTVESTNSFAVGSYLGAAPVRLAPHRSGGGEAPNHGVGGAGASSWAWRGGNVLLTWCKAADNSSVTSAPLGWSRMEFEDIVSELLVDDTLIAEHASQPSIELYLISSKISRAELSAHMFQSSGSGTSR